MTSYTQNVNSNGNVNYNDTNWNDKAIRPFWLGRCNKVGATPKLESQDQKNRQPFLQNKKQDKYKGVQYFDRK